MNLTLKVKKEEPKARMINLPRAKGRMTDLKVKVNKESRLLFRVMKRMIEEGPRVRKVPKMISQEVKAQRK